MSSLGIVNIKITFFVVKKVLILCPKLNSRSTSRVVIVVHGKGWVLGIRLGLSPYQLDRLGTISSSFST